MNDYTREKIANEERLEQAYRLTFNGTNEDQHEAAKLVLADLITYGHATRSTFCSDAMEMARREGRREMIIRILAFLKIDTDKTWELEANLY